VTLAKAHRRRAEAGRPDADSNPVVSAAFDIALKTRRAFRNASTHAAGIVIGGPPLSQWCRCIADSENPTCRSPSFNMKGSSRQGL